MPTAAGASARSAVVSGTEMGTPAWEEERIGRPREPKSPREGDEWIEGLRRRLILRHAVYRNCAVY